MDGAWVLPVVIFLAEAVVVTTSTIRVIFISRGKRGLAAILGFIEISIWLFAISHVMRNLDNPWCMLAFAWELHWKGKWHWAKPACGYFLAATHRH